MYTKTGILWRNSFSKLCCIDDFKMKKVLKSEGDSELFYSRENICYESGMSLDHMGVACFSTIQKKQSQKSIFTVERK